MTPNITPSFFYISKHDQRTQDVPHCAPQAIKNKSFDAQTIACGSVALIAQGIYSLTHSSLFRSLSISAMTWCAAVLAQKVFQQYTCMQNIERFCVFITTEYPLMPLVVQISATLTLKKLPILGYSLSILNGVFIGFSLRSRWNIGVMHARNAGVK